MEIIYKNSPVAFSVHGQGEPLILLHGFLENRKMWNELTPELSQTNQVVTIDLLGHGDTGSIGYVHTMEENANAVLAVLSELKIRRAILCGHSMGGYVALAIAEMRPEIVGGMILLNSTARPDSEERKTNRDRAIAAVKENHTSFVRMAVGNLFSEKNRSRISEKIEMVKQEALQTPLQGIVASLEGMKIRKDRQFVLKDRNFPCLIVLGTKDEVLNYDETRHMAEELSLDVIAFPDGHMSTLENRDELLHAMKNFIAAT